MSDFRMLTTAESALSKFNFTPAPESLRKFNFEFFMPGIGLVGPITLRNMLYTVTPVIMQSNAQREKIERINALVVNDAKYSDAVGLLPTIIPVEETTDFSEIDTDEPDTTDLGLDNVNLADIVETDDNEFSGLGFQIAAAVVYSVDGEEKIETIPLAVIDSGFPNAGDIPADISADDWYNRVRDSFLVHYDDRVEVARRQGELLIQDMAKIADYIAKNSSVASLAGESNISESDPNYKKITNARNTRISNFLNAVESISTSPESFDDLVMGVVSDDPDAPVYSMDFNNMYALLTDTLDETSLETLMINIMNIEGAFWDKFQTEDGEAADEVVEDEAETVEEDVAEDAVPVSPRRRR